MKLHSILIAVMAAALVAPVWAQQPAAAGSSAEAKAEAVFAALAPLVGPHSGQLAAAGVQKVVARTGKGRRDIQILTRWGPAYIPWPKDVTPVTFEIYIAAENRLDVTAEGYTEANKARYAAAFDAVLPQAVRAADAVRAQATRPKR